MGCSVLASLASGKKHSEISGLKSLNVGNTFLESWGSSETLFDDSPAERDTYILICKSQNFPLWYVCV